MSDFPPTIHWVDLSSGKSTSARPCRVEQERDEALHDLAHARFQLDMAKTRLAHARTELGATRALVEQLRADYSEAADENARLRGQLADVRDAATEQVRAAREAANTPTTKETPMPTTADDGSRAATLLSLPLPDNDADAPTVRDYLIALLREAWEQGENFCKRPFGNSGWQYEIYAPMVKAGLVPGTIGSDGELDDCDTRAADALMDEAIQALAADPERGGEGGSVTAEAAL